MTRRLLTILLVLQLILIPKPRCYGGVDSAEPQGNISTALEAWRQRERNVTTATFAWTRPQDGIARWGGNWPIWDAPEGHERVAASTVRITIDAQRLRYDAYRWIYDPKLLISSNSSNVYDVALLKKFLDPHSGVQPVWQFSRFVQDAKRRDRYTTESVPQVRWEVTSAANDHDQQSLLRMHARLEQCTDLDSLEYMPVLLHYRILSSSEISFRSDAARMDEATGKYRGRPCWQLVEELRAENPSMVRRYWIDPTRDCSIVRYVGELDGQPAVQIDVSFEEDEQGSWVPAAWTVQVFHSDYDRWPIFQKSQVTDYTINATFSEEALDAKFEPNSLVLDQIEDRIFHIWADGSSHPIEARELHQFTAAEDGSWFANWTRARIATLLSVMLTLCVGGAWLWLRSTKNRPNR